MTVTVDPGRQHALHGLYTENHHWLVELLLRRLRHRGDAQDIASETFLQIVASPDDPRGIREPRAYLTCIAKRLAYRLYRRRDLERAYLDRIALMEPAYAPSPEQCALELETILRMDAKLYGLPPDVRAAFLYSVFDELSYDEIAVRLRISSRTVARHVKRALLHCVAAGS
ncbi:heme uptake regulator [Bordetella ansorpii]|uniref:Heme uptake regulator n=1 Tax=Bordetella ansorpii TaxID=288768 RepID=A0A157NJY4_9BORD|nr:sigma-70 family RNA polymerase sigma factor [Bordetella ansorpii]SAI21336.1 heme uptake regulator [Bordetella ansorpii]